MLPEPKIITRTPDPELMHYAMAQGVAPLLARIIAARPQPPTLDIQQMLDPKLSCLDHPLSMQDMAKASKRLARAILNQEVIGLETDHDCDGQTSHAVLFYNLVHKFNHPKEKIRSYIGHRLKEGYGLSEKVAQRILQDEVRPTLVITADNGSADEDRIAKLHAQNIDVIVTDHHQLPKEGPPKSAYACLNPTREDCDYPDPYIAGCMVAWLLMSATRIELKIDDKLLDTLDFVAVGTVADCVSMARSYNNRAIVAAGLKLISAQTRPCWQAMHTLLKGPATAEDLGFKIGPLLNSDGRLATAFGSVSFLLSEDEGSAMKWLEHLQEQNTKRKSIQKDITNQGIEKAKEQVASANYSLCIYLPKGHAGVHGISASRIKDMFGRPTIFLANKQEEKNVLTGSIRGIDGFDVGDAIRSIQSETNILISGGGHSGAGGVSFFAKDLSMFASKFEDCARLQLKKTQIGPVIYTDGIISDQLISLDILESLSQLEPFGREFEAPIFELTGRLTEFRTIGDGTHARLTIQLPHKVLRGVWFNFHKTAEVGDQVRCAVTLKRNDYGGITRIEMQVAWLCKTSPILV